MFALALLVGLGMVQFRRHLLSVRYAVRDARQVAPDGAGREAIGVGAAAIDGQSCA
jgi:hypothetical protein